MQLMDLPVSGASGPLVDQIMRMPVDAQTLTGPQKAAIIVQMILSAGGQLSLSKLSKTGQTRLAHDFATMRHIDQETLNAVIAEFENHLDIGGLKFPDGIGNALTALDGTISGPLLGELRDRLGVETTEDPWPVLNAAEIEEMVHALSNESPRIGAIILSKLKPARAAAIVDALPAETANAIAFALSEVTAVTTESVERIGRTVAKSLSSNVEPTFPDTPVARAAAILNATGGQQRDAVLEGLVELDEDFAAKVRKAIFTFADIPDRVDATDIPKVARAVSSEDMVVALVAAQPDLPDAVSFILDNMSQRMADQLRDEMSETETVARKAGEVAMSQVTTAIRQLIDDGEITLAGEDENAD